MAATLQPDIGRYSVDSKTKTESSILKSWSRLPELKRQWTESCVYFWGSTARWVSRSKQVSPSVLNRSVTQHLCLDKMYRIRVMKDPKESPHECVDFMNELSYVFQRYIKHKQSVTGTLSCSCVFSPQKTKHNQWLNDPITAFFLGIGLFIKPLFLMEETGRKRITLIISVNKD